MGLFLVSFFAQGQNLDVLMTEAQDSLDSRQLGLQAKRILKRTVTAATQKKEKQWK